MFKMLDTDRRAREYVLEHHEFAWVLEKALGIHHTYIVNQDQLEALLEDLCDGDSPLLDSWCRDYVDSPENR